MIYKIDVPEYPDNENYNVLLKVRVRANNGQFVLITGPTPPSDEYFFYIINENVLQGVEHPSCGSSYCDSNTTSSSEKTVISHNAKNYFIALVFKEMSIYWIRAVAFYYECSQSVQYYCRELP